jgi:hypothetical protein
MSFISSLWFAPGRVLSGPCELVGYVFRCCQALLLPNAVRPCSRLARWRRRYIGSVIAGL